MRKHWMLKLAVCLIYISTCIPVCAALPEGDPWGGEAVSVAASGTTMLYAARKNINASDTGAEAFDFYNWNYTVEDNPEKMAVRALEAGASWYYTVNIERAGDYQLDVLGWSGWATAEKTDGGGRFSLEIGGTKLVDGAGDNPVILPPFGDGTAAGSHKLMSQFTDADKTSLGTVSLEAGTQVLKFTADNPASGRMNLVKIWLTGSEPVIAEGEPWGGEAVSVASLGTTLLYASRKNVNALDSGTEIYDFYDWNYTVEENPEKMAVRANADGASWYYTVDIAKAGEYQIDVLGWGGYASVAGAQPSGRFSLEIGGTKVVDGTGANPVILPAWGEGTANGSNKTKIEFTDADKTSLGTVSLEAGLQVLKFTADNRAGGHMNLVKIWLTGPDPVIAEGDPWGGEAVSVAASGTTMLYAARKNVNALDSGTEAYDFYGWTYTVEDNPEKMSVRALEAGASWYYTVDIEAAGLYQIDVLGWGGYASLAGAQPSGRFSLEVDGTKLVDGTGANPVILPAWGDGTAAGSNKSMTQFKDDDKVNLGTVYLEAGIRVLKMTADHPASGHMGFSKIWFKAIPMLTGLTIDAEAVVARGGTKQLSYSCDWSFEGDEAVSPTLAWASSDPSVCTVADGVVTGLAKGNATITLEADDGWNTFTKNCAVTVNVMADSVSLNQGALALQPGESYTLTATVLPADTDDPSIIWSSSNREVVSVNQGVITAAQAGIADITATCGTVSATARVTVTSPSDGNGRGNGGGSGGGGGGGFRYVGAGVISANETDINQYTVTNGTLSAMSSTTLETILEKHASVIYHADTNEVSGELNSDFFTEQPGSKSLVFKMPWGTVTVGADALNQTGADNIDTVAVKLGRAEDAITVELSVNGAAVSNLNHAVSVSLPADSNTSYAVSRSGSDVSVTYTDDAVSFPAASSGTYQILMSAVRYADADKVTWATQSIYQALEKGLLRPNNRDAFGAEQNISRGELVSAVIKGIGLSAEADGGFEDVPADHANAREIAVAKALGIVNGVDGINFMPAADITRQDVAVIVYKALQVNGQTLEQSAQLFSDNDMISDYARDAVYALTGVGYLKGREHGFDPLAKMTKAEAAVLLGRICGW